MRTMILVMLCCAACCSQGAAAELKATPGQNYYTTEESGDLLLRLSAELVGKTLIVDVSLGDARVATRRIRGAGDLVPVPISLQGLPIGDSEFVCRVQTDGRELATATTKITKLAPSDNAVKIDNFTGGLIVDGLPFFPFGFYCYSPVPPRLADGEIVNGFKHISPYQGNDPKDIDARRTYMDRCAALGMKVHYQLLSIAGGGGVYGANVKDSAEKQALLRAEVEAFRDHPALLAWYISDEPEGSNVSRDALAATYRLIKELDPYHPITVVFMSPPPARAYAAAIDIVMADPYPMPHGAVTSVSDMTAALVGEFRGEKPVWIVPQAFGGNEFWLREPTPQEERAMTYLALIHGATGIQYFIRKPPNSFPKSTIAWAECSRMALETAELTPDLLSREPRPKVTASPTTVHAAAWLHRGLVTVLAVNTEKQPRTVRLRLDGIRFSGKARAPFEDRDADVRNGVIEEPIAAYGTLAYQIRLGPAPADDLAPLAENLMPNPSFEDLPTVGVPSACYADAGQGATYFVDSRLARHGRHSLRLTAPAPDQTVSLAFFPLKGPFGAPHNVSIWGRAQSPGARFKLSLGTFAEKEFTLTTEWKKYELPAACPKDHQLRGGVSVGLRLTSAGTAWFDLVQALRIRDPEFYVPTNTFAESGWVALRSCRKGARIRYTLDPPPPATASSGAATGMEPNESSTLYEGPLRIDRATTVRAVSFTGPDHTERSATATADFKVVRLPKGGSVYLSAVTPVAFDTWMLGPVQREFAEGEVGLRLRGKEYKHGLFIHPGGVIDAKRGSATYLLSDGLTGATRFSAVIGIADDVPEGSNGSSAFIVEVHRAGKWERAFESEVLRAGGETRKVSVDISGADQLRLITTDGGDGVHSDHAVWADARVE